MNGEPIDEISFSVPETPAVDNAPLFVSLYVVLLAFFILLNTISRVDENRADTVVDSVNYAFSDGTNTISAPKVQESAGVETAITSFFHQMQRIVAALVQLEEVQIVHAGNTMQITIPLQKLFAKGDIKLREDADRFITNLSAALVDWRPGMRTELEFLMGSPIATFSTMDGMDKGTVLRSGNLARALIKNGIAAKDIVVGVKPGTPDKVVINFNIRQIDLAKVRPMVMREQQRPVPVKDKTP